MKKNQIKILEIIAVVVTGLLKFVMMDWLQWRFPYIAGAVLFWIGYIVYRYNKDPLVLAHWGFQKENFNSCFMALLPWAVGSVLLFFAYGYFTGRLILSWYLFPILLLYPIWGVIQQFMIVGIIAGNLRSLDNTSISKWQIVLITAMVFASVHFPSILLVSGTFLLALVYTHYFIKHNNIWPLGIFHGWLGGFFFYFVMERDVWMEVFGGLMN